MGDEAPVIRPSLTTPRSAAIAGIAFALLLTLAFVMIRLSLPADPGQGSSWLSDPNKRTSVGLALNLLPFAGIAFLWFIGVIRDDIGSHEDRFFATVLLGSGLLFVAMLFASAAVAAGLRMEVSSIHGSVSSSDAWRINARITSLLLNIYAMRMAAVFTISVATISLRTGVIPSGSRTPGTRAPSCSWSASASARGCSCSSRCGSCCSASTSCGGPGRPRPGSARGRVQPATR